MAANDPSSAADWLARRRRLDSLLRLQAAVMMGDPGQVEAVRMLAEALGDSEVDVRELAAAALSDFGPDTQVALPELIKAVQDESPIVRRRALRAIGAIGVSAADDALPCLIAATEDIDDSVALQAVAALGELGPPAAPAVPALMSVVWTGDVRRRAIAGVALTRIGDAAVPSLIQSLSHPAAEVRVKVAHLLGQIGPAAVEARSALQTLAADKDEAVRNEAAAALRQIGAS
jgi:HEAT repeat protein